jgi:transposase
VATLAVTARADLTDAQWAVLEPLLPAGGQGRPPKWAKRQLIDGIRWRVRAGAPWRDVPPAYGPWQTVYGLLRRWQRDGTWQAVLTGLQAVPAQRGASTGPCPGAGQRGQPPGPGPGSAWRGGRLASLTWHEPDAGLLAHVDAGGLVRAAQWCQRGGE